MACALPINSALPCCPQVQIKSANSTATITGDLGDVCGRQVYTIGTLLVPKANIADIPQDIRKGEIFSSAWLNCVADALHD